MKKIYTFLISGLCALGLQAQTELYTNNFDSPGSFTLDAAGSFNAWLINNVYQGGTLFSGTPIPTVPSQPASFSNPNQNYLHPSSPLALSGSFQTITNANYVAGSGFGSLRAYMGTSIDATEYTNVTVSFWRVGGLNGMKVIYSINGGQTWQDAGLNFQGSPSAWTEETIVLPALDGQSDVRIGFEMMEAQLADPAPNPYHSIDELKITGTPEITGEITTTLTTPIDGFCAGQSITANFNVVSGTIGASNQYTLELSDASGDFDNGVVVATLASAQTSGSIIGALPSGLAGTNFRVRVLASDAAIVGADNGSDFVISEVPDAPIITLNTVTGQLEVTTDEQSFMWYFFNDPVANSQNQTAISPLMNGGYTVIASNGKCETSSVIYVVNFVSIQEENLTNNSVFPNPVSSTLFLDYDQNATSEILVSDISGKLVFHTKENIASIDFTKLNSGLYFVSFVGETTQTIKVVKE
jgi:hypothetical protein